MATEMFAVFREVLTPGFTDESYVVSPVMSDTPDSPDEIPGTRHWIEAIVRQDCEKRNLAVRRARDSASRQVLRDERARMRRKAAAHNFAPHMFIDDELPKGEGSHVCQKQDVRQLYRVCRSCHYQAQRELAALPNVE